MRSLACIVVLLTALVFADARAFEPVTAEERASSACDKCLVVSRKAEVALKSPKLFDEANQLSHEACQVFPRVSQDKCLRKSGAYVHEARQILHEFFEEVHLCNSTGLCARSNSAVADNCLVADELQDERACATCRRAVKDIIIKLKQPKMKAKIVEALLDYCEEIDEEEERCKRTIYQYLPMVLHKLKAQEMCSMIGMCTAEISMKI